MFTTFARATERAVGSPWAFMLAAASVVLWALTGPFFGYSDTWQLICNTATTIVTFLIVFLIQSTQSRDTLALQLKMDEIIRVTEGARNAFIELEEKDEASIARVKADLAKSADEELG